MHTPIAKFFAAVVVLAWSLAEVGNVVFAAAVVAAVVVFGSIWMIWRRIGDLSVNTDDLSLKVNKLSSKVETLESTIRSES